MRFLLYSTFYICVAQVYGGMFNFNTDNFMKRYLSGIFTARPDLFGNTVTPIDIKAHVRRTKAEPKTTPKRVSFFNRFRTDFNITRKEYELRKLKLNIDMIINKNHTEIDFHTDEIAVLSRRFDNIRGRPSNYKESLREIYFDDEEKAKFSVQKNKTLLLMEQFIYETKYKLPYVQIIQKKYMNTFRYQIGYCFAMLQHLKQEQYVLYSTMKKYIKKYQNLFIHVKMYEKIIRLDIDIKDLVAFIKKINWDRMQIETLDYFNQVKKLQQ